MNIAFLTWANNWHVPVKTKYFVKKGHKVFYFELFPGTGQNIPTRGVERIQIKSDKKNRYLNLIEKISEVRRLTKEYNIDVLHIIDMNHAIYAPFSLAKRVVIENNGSDVLVKPKKKPYLKLFYRLMYRFVDAVVQDSYVSQKAGISYGASKANNEVIELGIDFDVFNREIEKGKAAELLGIPEDRRIIFSPRGFTQLYNIDTIIASIPEVRKRFENVVYVFCRHFGGDWEKYKKMAEELGVGENVLFTGFLDNELDMPYIYRDAEAVVSVPSSDSSPRSVYEAMACGTPAVVSDLPWYHGKFDKDRDLTVIPVGDSKMLAEATIQVLSNRPDGKIENAYKKVRENIDMMVHSEKLEKLYKRII